MQSATIAFSPLAVTVLEAMVITGEYGTGMIRPTLTAVPKRLPALFSQATVFGVVTVAVSLARIFTTALLAQLIFSSRGLNIDLADERAWGPLTGGVAFLTLAGLIALYLGTIVRISTGGISAALGLIIVAPIVLQIFAAVTRASWVQNVFEFLPRIAGVRKYAYAATPAPNIPDVIVLIPGQGPLVMIARVLFFGIIASLLLNRRDA